MFWNEEEQMKKEGFTGSIWSWYPEGESPKEKLRDGLIVFIVSIILLALLIFTPIGFAILLFLVFLGSTIAQICNGKPMK